MRPLPLIAGACSAAALWLTRPEFVDHWDEVQLALGVLEFDLTRHHPHPPGYPGVIALGRALLPLTGDALEALRASSALAVGAWVTLVSSGLPSARARAVTALLTVGVAAWPVLSPLLGYQGRSGLSYAWEATAWTAFALLLTRRQATGAQGARRGPWARPWLRQLGLGLAAGAMGALRPNLSLWGALLFLLQRPAVSRVVPFAVGWVLAVGACGALLLHASGGAEAWWGASEVVLQNIQRRSLLHADAAAWLTRLAMPGQLALALGPLLLLLPKLRRVPSDTHVLLQAAALAFLFHFVLIHDTSSYLSAPAACVAAWLLLQAGCWAQDLPRALVALGLTLATAVVPAWPLFDRQAPPPGAPHDALLRGVLSVIHQSSPAQTLVLTTTPGWRLGMRHLGWHAPEVRVLQLTPDPGVALSALQGPYLSMRGRRLEAHGPADLDAASVADGALARVLVVGPTEGFLAEGCAPERVGEQVVALPPSTRISAGQLICP